MNTNKTDNQMMLFACCIILQCIAFNAIAGLNVADTAESKRMFTLFERYKTDPMYLIYALDSSGTVNSSLFNLEVDFVEQSANIFRKNQTQLAVMTYADKDKIDIPINYIQNSQGDCSLKDAIKNVTYKAESRPTSSYKSVLEKSYDIFPEEELKNITRLLVMLTNGLSDSTEDPRGIAEQMRKDGIVIIPIALQTNVSYGELRDVAGDGENVIRLDDSEDLRGICNIMRGDIKHQTEWELVDDSNCDFLCTGGNCCEAHNSSCTFALESVSYQCACKPGYTWSDVHTECLPCGIGTFKSIWGNHVCLTCPGNSNTSNPGSTGKSDCQCVEGFQKNSRNNCQAVTCNAMISAKGVDKISKHCGHSFNDVCMFGCATNYKMVGGDVERVCQANGSWSGQHLQCSEIICDAPNVENGILNCRNQKLSIGTDCHVTCEEGYELSGNEAVRRCEKSGESGVWSGRRLECKPVECSPIKLHKGGANMIVTPAECWNSSLPYKTVCMIACVEGYALKGQENRMCQANKMWSSNNITKCIDNEPPAITNCPFDITVNTDSLKNTAKVTWDKLNVVDNSGNPSKVKVITKDGNGKNTTPYTTNNEFPIGRTKVVIKARDEKRNQATCSFYVTVIDADAPVVVFCEEDIKIKTLQDSFNVTWREPTFEDNSGMPFEITSNVQSGYEVKQGERVLVSYKAKDSSGNTASCDFYVAVATSSCSFQEAPRNGNIIHTSLLGGNQVYRIACKQGYQFWRETEDVYYCRNSNWVDSSSNKPDLSWPDCSAVDNGGLALDVGLTYYTRPCPKQGAYQTKTDLKAFEDKFSAVIHDVCYNCSIETTETTCRYIPTRYNPRPAYATYYLQFKILLGSEASHADDPDVKKTVDDIENAVRTGRLSYKFGTYINLHLSKLELYFSDVSTSCRQGQISRSGLCVNCPVGTFYSDGSCIGCKKGFYQDQEAQKTCKSCPEGSTTDYEYAKSSFECKGPCKPGTYSITGMERCSACPVGTYQSRGRQRRCFTCRGLTTLMPGATSFDDCQGVCQPGTYSLSTLTPCTRCPLGTYQPLRKQSTCISCPPGTHTLKVGASTEALCQVVNECLSLPCRNKGQCYDLAEGYKCVCLKGFSGDNCEIDLNECAPGICKNNGMCVDRRGHFRCVCPRGFKGRTCQTNIDDCRNNRCSVNSKCVDGIDSYTCECTAGFTGSLCDVNYDDCINDPCVNGGSCFDGVQNFTCCCPPGYEGHTCANEVDECKQQPCQNNGTCVADFNSYRCLCAPGSTGLNCEVAIKVDGCQNVTCYNGGECEDLMGDFRCLCPLGYVGIFCQAKLSSNFDLHFSSTNTTEYAIYKDLPDLYAFTLSFWMQSFDADNYGTPISYATTLSDGSIIDNAITILNYNSFILYINGEAVFTGVKANDGFRHHVCVTWDSVDGFWAIYMDAVLANSGYVQIGNFIKGGGMFVIGQEQDSLGGSFVKTESYVGLISQVNVFDHVLSLEKRLVSSSSCGMYGNALAWPLIATTVQGGLLPTYNSYVCHDVDQCFISPCLNGGSCENFRTGYICHCPIGYQGHHCELISSFCDPQSCKNDAQCLDGTSEFFCICQPGYHGLRCANKTDMCAVQQTNCLNGGTCITKDGKAVCECLPGRSGKTCQYDVNECLKDNGNCDHQCYNDPGSFHCACRDGFALQPDRRTCNDISYCKHEDVVYRVGERWSGENCSECSCVDGRPRCVQKTCPDLECSENEQSFHFPGTCCPSCLSEPARCIILPNKKVWTFDDHSFLANGDCRYTMARDYVTGNFSIQLEHNQNYTEKAIYLNIDCVLVYIDFNGSVTVSGKSVQLPYLHDNPQNVLISEFGTMGVSVITNRGVKLIWKEDGKVTIYVPSQYSGMMEGLCGNMNKDKKDDSLTRQKLPSKSVEELVHSWKVKGYRHCKDERVQEDPDINDNVITREYFPACVGKPQYVLDYARTQCEDIVIGQLSACHSFVEPHDYYYLCMQDSCVCGINKPCFCQSLSAYVTECQRQNVDLQNYNGKLSQCGVKCEPGFLYDDCGPSPECQLTCFTARKLDSSCGHRQCEPGCYCPAGRVLHEDRCIMKSECPTP
ncbi:sushi, von Willebrand factor type A, EGF and pentraxin domain-containing protein 1-like [Antedon mediterranea]|uniref:sushi, von Willebrand factor type A, EGF and pentraxin domain-containing protein 1-like n=1 Tax=Antedon mediterranea TaxID=105859 RepID=UPI003AF4B4CC